VFITAGKKGLFWAKIVFKQNTLTQVCFFTGKEKDVYCSEWTESTTLKPLYNVLYRGIQH